MAYLIFEPWGRLQLRHVERVANLDGGDVDLDLHRDALGQRLDRDLVGGDGEDAAGGDALGPAGGDDRDLHQHGLVEGDLEEVGVEEPAADRVDLVVLEEDLLHAALELERDEGVPLVRGGDRLHHRARVDRDRGGLGLEAVDDGGDEAALAQAAGRALAVSGAGLGGEEILDVIGH